MKELTKKEIELVTGGMNWRLRPMSKNVEDRRTNWRTHPLWKKYRGIFPRFRDNFHYRFP